MKVIYPKTLILIVNFNPMGSGITVRNLFYNWPKSKLANASLQVIEDRTICDLYYTLHTSQFPIVNRINNDDKEIASQIIDRNSVANGFKKKLLIGFKNFLEQKYIINKIKIDGNLIKWISSHKFDLLYAIPSTAKDIPFLIRLKKLTNLPLAVHIFDDWVEHNRFGYFKIIFKPLLEHDFKKLLKIADLKIAICEDMKIAYEKRYKAQFYYFHNPAHDTANLSSIDKERVPNSIEILFIGTIGEHNIDLFVALGHAIDVLQSEKIKIKLRFFGYISKPFILGVLDTINGLEINKPLDNHQIPEILANSDILLLPLSFSKSQKNYIQYSMPTKVSEYLASGVPILVMAPDKYALTNYAVKGQWAFVVSEINVNKLVTAIKELIFNDKLRAQIVSNAQNEFYSKHRIEGVSESFRDTLSTIIANEYSS
ncbi:MAG TPA: glycosyltransferase [bacterium]|nr:glycosyltransferase [bacterium]